MNPAPVRNVYTDIYTNNTDKPITTHLIYSCHHYFVRWTDHLGIYVNGETVYQKEGAYDMGWILCDLSTVTINPGGSITIYETFANNSDFYDRLLVSSVPVE